MTHSAVIAAAYMFALSQNEFLRDGYLHHVPTASQPQQFDSHDVERIARAEAKRARKAAKRRGG